MLRARSLGPPDARSPCVRDADADAPARPPARRRRVTRAHACSTYAHVSRGAVAAADRHAPPRRSARRRDARARARARTRAAARARARARAPTRRRTRARARDARARARPTARGRRRAPARPRALARADAPARPRARARDARTRLRARPRATTPTRAHVLRGRARAAAPLRRRERRRSPYVTLRRQRPRRDGDVHARACAARGARERAPYPAEALNAASQATASRPDPTAWISHATSRQPGPPPR